MAQAQWRWAGCCSSTPATGEMALWPETFCWRSGLRSRTDCLVLFPYQVLNVSVVLAADVLANVVVSIEIGNSLDDPGFCVSSRIIDRELNFQVPQIGAAKTFHNVHLFRVRMTLSRDPRAVVETGRIDHERVSLPMPD